MYEEGLVLPGREKQLFGRVVLVGHDLFESVGPMFPASAAIEVLYRIVRGRRAVTEIHAVVEGSNGILHAVARVWSLKGKDPGNRWATRSQCYFHARFVEIDPDTDLKKQEEARSWTSTFPAEALLRISTRVSSTKSIAARSGAFGENCDACVRVLVFSYFGCGFFFVFAIFQRRPKLQI